MFTNTTCQVSTCRRNFHTLSDLILHNENAHLDFDPDRLAQLEDEKPDSLPLSYVLKFGGPDDSPPVIEVVDSSEEVNNNQDYGEVKPDLPRAASKLFVLDHNHKKPFVCNMNGCEKRYKNVNGIKYHYKKHHKMLVPAAKKSILKHKPVPQPRVDRGEMMGIPVYDNFDNYRRYSGCEAYSSEYFYVYNGLPGPQVPLPSNMSFNYYRVGESDGEMPDFQLRNGAPHYFVPNFDN